MYISLILFLVGLFGMMILLNVGYWYGVQDGKISIWLSSFIGAAVCAFLAYKSVSMLGG